MINHISLSCFCFYAPFPPVRAPYLKSGCPWSVFFRKWYLLGVKHFASHRHFLSKNTAECPWPGIESQSNSLNISLLHDLLIAWRQIKPLYLVTVNLHDQRPSTTFTRSEVISHVTVDRDFSWSHLQRVSFITFTPEKQGIPWWTYMELSLHQIQSVWNYSKANSPFDCQLFSFAVQCNPIWILGKFGLKLPTCLTLPHIHLKGLFSG